MLLMDFLPRCRFNEAGAKSPGERAAVKESSQELMASMRPERKAPENVYLTDLQCSDYPASMRPERKAPENSPSTTRRTYRRCFNEAGAKSPGEHGFAPTRAATPPGFNEAGAKSPGEPRNVLQVFRQLPASMRPERKAPENAVAISGIRTSRLLQ